MTMVCENIFCFFLVRIYLHPIIYFAKYFLWTLVVICYCNNNIYAPDPNNFLYPNNLTVAAVCAFEAYINGKHVVGKVEEKEEARVQYKEAVKAGHGAYLGK